MNLTLFPSLLCFPLHLPLSFPNSPPYLPPQVYQWMSVLLSPYHPSLATHCLLHSTHISLSHHAATILGKRIHKRSHRDSKHPFHNVLITLQDSTEVCPESSDPLVKARAILCPPTPPPPLSLTLSLISSLPDDCQFTVACLSPSISSQVSLSLPPSLPSSHPPSLSPSLPLYVSLSPHISF